jgi:hypothetical protein
MRALRGWANWPPRAGCERASRAQQPEVMPADRNIEYLTGSLKEAIAAIARTRVP